MCSLRCSKNTYNPMRSIARIRLAGITFGNMRALAVDPSQGSRIVLHLRAKQPLKPNHECWSKLRGCFALGSTLISCALNSTVSRIFRSLDVVSCSLAAGLGTAHLPLFDFGFPTNKPRSCAIMAQRNLSCDFHAVSGWPGATSGGSTGKAPEVTAVIRYAAQNYINGGVWVIFWSGVFRQ